MNAGVRKTVRNASLVTKQREGLSEGLDPQRRIGDFIARRHRIPEIDEHARPPPEKE
jgi:hypothetical protein